MKRFLSAAILVLAFAVTVFAQQEKTNVSVSASVESDAGPIQAKLVPGEFDIPAGMKAVNLRVGKNTILMGQASSSNQRSDKDIYCVSSASYVPAAQAELPAGKYKFVVGGGPGSMGTLTYDLVQAK